VCTPLPLSVLKQLTWCSGFSPREPQPWAQGDLDQYFNFGLTDAAFKQWIETSQVCLRLEKAKRNKIAVGGEGTVKGPIQAPRSEIQIAAEQQAAAFPQQYNLPASSGDMAGPGQRLFGAKVGGGQFTSFQDPRDIPAPGEEPRNIYICGFPVEWGEPEIRAVFEPFGKVNNIMIMHNQFKTGVNKGAGFVNLGDNDLSLQVIQRLNGQPIRGREDLMLEVRLVGVHIMFLLVSFCQEEHEAHTY
jgi:hypothetical protein